MNHMRRNNVLTKSEYKVYIIQVKIYKTYNIYNIYKKYKNIYIHIFTAVFIKPRRCRLCDKTQGLFFKTW